MIPHTLSTPILRELCNHLWQSTLFTAAIALLALALRQYPARVRYWLWLTASAKFLIPFSLLIAIGTHIPRPRHAPQSTPTTYIAIDEISQPFTELTPLNPTPLPLTTAPQPTHRLTLPTILAALWLTGLLTVLTSWLIQWRRVTTTLRTATPLHTGREHETLRKLEHLARTSRPTQILASPTSLEPGVFGILHPILLWPTGLSPHLDDAHLETILAHELCHIRRRDNLTSALHMLVEAIFWFHPFVWWIESRLVEERERACDEAVVLLCNQPQVYAESILKVCELCIESPLTCVSGITGADLKKRIVQIMRDTVTRKLTFATKSLLAASALATIAAPILLGQAKAAQQLSALILQPLPFLQPSAPLTSSQTTTANSDTQVTAVPDSTSGPAFEVATIRPAKSGTPPGFHLTPSGRFTATEPLFNLVVLAYAKKDRSSTVVAGPKWEDSPQLYEISAKVDDANMVGWEKLSDAERYDRVWPMLRTLLAERFHLKLNLETKSTPVYALVQAKGGAKIKEVSAEELQSRQSRDQDSPTHKPTPGASARTGNTWNGNAVPIANLVGLVAGISGSDRPVVDQTGLKGSYDFTFDVPNGTDGATAPELIEHGLGLKLEPRKVPMKTYVILSAAKPSLDGAELSEPPPATLKPAAFVQEKPAPTPPTAAPYVPTMTFDVASIRESKDATAHGGGFGAHSELTILNMPVLWLLQMGYGVETRDISGQPDWAGQTDFFVQAKSDAAADQKLATLDKEQASLERKHMVQALLAERFNLKVHWETRDRDVYNLVLAKGGSKLQPPGSMKPSPQESWPGDPKKLPPIHQEGDRFRGYEFYGHDCPLEVLSGLISSMFGKDVVNKTGLTGNFDFHIRYHGKRPGDNRDEDPATVWPPLIDALEDQLGLKLEPAKGSVRVLIIDHIDKPSEN
jgi:bla regulator protein blaR1